MALAFVARGALDCFYMEKLQPWDVAAGVLIIREAGGSVIDSKGVLMKRTRTNQRSFLNLRSIIYI